MPKGNGGQGKRRIVDDEGRSRHGRREPTYSQMLKIKFASRKLLFRLADVRQLSLSETVDEVLAEEAARIGLI